MHFGDGTSKEIEASAIDPEKAVEEIKDWVLDNAWFEVTEPETDAVIAETRLSE